MCCSLINPPVALRGVYRCCSHKVGLGSPSRFGHLNDILLRFNLHHSPLTISDCSHRNTLGLYRLNPNDQRHLYRSIDRDSDLELESAWHSNSVPRSILSGRSSAASELCRREKCRSLIANSLFNIRVNVATSIFTGRRLQLFPAA